MVGKFPQTRMRRVRQAAWIRDLVAQTTLSARDFMWPVFVCEGEKEIPIATMPGVSRLPVSRIGEAAVRAHGLGIPAIALFPATPPEKRSENGDEALNPENLVCRAVRAVKREVPEIGVMCDVALDPYTSHGHDGLLREGKIANDETLAVLVKQALVQAQAGCDIIAPSDMMDGRVAAIREALEQAGHKDCMILSYAAKYASSLYSPFRDAVGAGAVLQGDKKTYQMDSANSDEALREVALDLDEGADMVMVKPGLFYLDIIRRVREQFQVPVFAYQVSGEYAMLAVAGEHGVIDRKQVMMESLLALKRAGANGILTYFALEAAEHLRAG